MDPEELEQALLGAPCELTREDVAAAVGISEAEATELWTAMGSAEVPSGQRAFTRLDVASLHHALALRDGGLVVKTLGDAVMFTTDDPGTAVEVALRSVRGYSSLTPYLLTRAD